MPLNGVAPVLFAIHDGQRIAVYLCASAKGVTRAEEDFAEKTAAADVIAHGRYAAANALAVYDYASSRSAMGEDIRVAQAVQALAKHL
ncbi:hypothetical protein I8J29_27720 [Paenibacillus sp. MWE-103]|uniref:Uncharacterized protein n=1 Tax=Paenibacillus artemisiicola TaxID=1172618 RepID=A0ABS3WI65_9BACL|nr:hypothetical protein [Paenibacillus artemisiicola]MBO7747987.1 hypothetical protein [Paenibacillus artemisiicola]